MKKIKFLEDFKAFAMRGNVIDMAVGVIVGGAFGKIVSSLVDNLLMPVVGIFVGGVNFSDLQVTLKHAVADATGAVTSPAVTLKYGAFIQSVFDFLIIAFCIFLFVKLIGKLTAKKEEAPAAPAPVPDDIKLLSEIRDLLKKERK